MTLRNLLSLALVSGFIFVAGPVQAAAGEAANPEERTQRDIEEIVVTATKRETGLMETPIAVSAFSQGDLTRKGVNNFLDMDSLAPGLKVGHSPSDSGVQVTVRGISSNNFTELGDPTVGIHFDGSYSPRPQGGLAVMHDVERVEILRGPQGTLFGRNSTSGSINVISKRPNFEEIEGSVDVELGRYNHRLLRGVLNLPATDRVAFRLSFAGNKRDSYIQQASDTLDLEIDIDNDGRICHVDDDPACGADLVADGVPNVDQRRNNPADREDAYFNADNWGVRLNTQINLSDNTDWLLSYDYFEDNSAGSLSLKDCEKAAGTFFACEQQQRYVSTNLPGVIDMSIATIRSQFSWDFTDTVTLEYRVAWSEQDRHQRYDGTVAYGDPDHPAYGLAREQGKGGAFFPDESLNLVKDRETLERLATEFRSPNFVDVVIPALDDLQLTTNYSNYVSRVHELQFKSTDSASLQWIFGLFRLEEENSIRFDVENPFCCSFIRPQALAFVQPDRRVESTAAFVQFDWSVTDDLNVTAGYRYTKDEKQDKGGSNHETTGYFGDTAGLYTEDQSDNAFWFESFQFVGGDAHGIQSWPDYYQADDLTLADGTLGENFLTRVPGTDNTYSADWSKGTWKVGYDYFINEQWFIYGYVATGYKSGGFGDRLDICNCGIIESFDYDPEQNLTIEQGFKATFLDGKLNLLGTLFHSDYTDIQQSLYATITPAGSMIEDPNGNIVEVPTDIGTQVTNNLSEASITGLEIEFDWQAWEGGRITGWINYLDASVDKLPGAQDDWYCLERAIIGLTPCAPYTTPDGRLPTDAELENIGSENDPLDLGRYADFSGNSLPWSPEWSATVNIEHNWWIGTDERISPYLTINWTDEYFFNNNNFDEGAFHSGQESITTYDFSIRYINGRQGYSVVLYAYNVTDEYKRTWSDGGPGFLRANFGPPRTYGLRLNKAF